MTHERGIDGYAVGTVSLRSNFANHSRAPLPSASGGVEQEKSTRPLGAHIWTKDPDGFYIEPAWVDERLFDVESFAGTIIDPACGIGRIPDAARAAGYQTIATDLIDRGYEHFDGIADFLRSDRRVANIICNPPYYICRNFALHALRQAHRKVAMIWLARRLNAAIWRKATPLRSVYLLNPRPSMPSGFVYTPAATRKYEAHARLAAQLAMGDQGPLQVPVRIELLIELPVPTSWSNKRRLAALAGAIVPTSKPDIDNYVKTALDAINTIVVIDDALVVEMQARSAKVGCDRDSTRYHRR